MVFIYKAQVRLRDTDATGVIYFSEQLRMAEEAFEAVLEAGGMPFSCLENKDYSLPIVHAEADYSHPLRVGDRLEIHVSVLKVGSSSLTMGYRFVNPALQREVGTVSIVHVCTHKKKQCSRPLPAELTALLDGVFVV